MSESRQKIRDRARKRARAYKIDPVVESLIIGNGALWLDIMTDNAPVTADTYCGYYAAERLRALIEHLEQKEKDTVEKLAKAAEELLLAQKEREEYRLDAAAALDQVEFLKGIYERAEKDATELERQLAELRAEHDIAQRTVRVLLDVIEGGDEPEVVFQLTTEPGGITPDVMTDIIRALREPPEIR